MDTVTLALANADRAVRGEVCAPAPQPTVTRAVTIGDPQATAEQFFAILAENGLLASNGWLRPDVRLISVGDHFDFGPFTQRLQAGQAGLRVLAWLVAHAPEHVVVLLGNHDLARVGELLHFDDASFELAATTANRWYEQRTGLTEHEFRQRESEFLEQFPALPSIETAARDFSAFAAAQRELVLAQLRAGRFRLAFVLPSVLVCHAGVTTDTVGPLQLSPRDTRDAVVLGDALNARLDQAARSWDGTVPFTIPDVHEPGSAELGDGFGLLLHRPAFHPSPVAATFPQRARRYDPRAIPGGVTQVIGHIRDPKCRALLGPWVLDAAATEGRLRSLVSDVQHASYRFGVQEASDGLGRIVFVDGGMNAVGAGSYELLDLGRWASGTELLHRFGRS